MILLLVSRCVGSGFPYRIMLTLDTLAGIGRSVERRR